MHLLVDGPARALKVLLACENQKKNLIFWRCLHFIDLVLIYCSDINKRNWLQLLFYFFFFDGFICLGFWKEFFPVFQFLSWSNLVLLLGKPLQMDSKTDLFTNGLIFGFLLGIWLFSLASYLYGLKLAWIAETCFFWWHQVFRKLLWVILWATL